MNGMLLLFLTLSLYLTSRSASGTLNDLRGIFLNGHDSLFQYITLYGRLLLLQVSTKLKATEDTLNESNCIILLLHELFAMLYVLPTYFHFYKSSEYTGTHHLHLTKSLLVKQMGMITGKLTCFSILCTLYPSSLNKANGLGLLDLSKMRHKGQTSHPCTSSLLNTFSMLTFTLMHDTNPLCMNTSDVSTSAGLNLQSGMM